MSVFTQRMSTFDFQLHQRCQLRRARFYLKNMHRIKEWTFLWQKLKNARGTEMVKLVASNCTMLYEGKKLGRNSQFWLDYQHCSSVLSLVDADQIIIILLRKHWSRDLFQKHKRLWLEQGCHSQRFPLKVVFVFFCHFHDFLETIIMFVFFFVSKADLSSHQIM